VFKTSGSIKERTQTSTSGHQLSMKWALARSVALGSDQSSVSRLRQGGVPEGAVH